MARARKMAIPQDHSDREVAHIAAVRSLKHELELAITLLRTVKAARDTLAIENQAVESARSGFRHAVEALDRMPQLTATEMLAVQRLIEEFRSALTDLNY